MEFNFNGEEFNSPIPRRNWILTKTAILSDQITCRIRQTQVMQQLSKEVENEDYDAMSLRESEKGIVRIDKIEGEIDHLMVRYKKSIEEDDKSFPRP